MACLTVGAEREFRSHRRNPGGSYKNPARNQAHREQAEMDTNRRPGTRFLTSRRPRCRRRYRRHRHRGDQLRRAGHLIVGELLERSTDLGGQHAVHGVLVRSGAMFADIGLEPGTHSVGDAEHVVAQCCMDAR